MATTATVYNNYKLKLFDSSTKISWTTDTIKAGFVTTAYSPDIDIHDFWDDVSANEASATGYTAGGPTLANASATLVGASDLIKLDADDISLTISTSFSYRYIVLYKSTGTGSTSPLIGYIDIGATQTITTGTLTVSFNASGIMTTT